MLALVSLQLLIPHSAAQAGLCKWCPQVVPQWTPTWVQAESTIAMPCNGSGLIRPSTLSQYALVSIDWSNIKNVWVTGKPMDAETPLLEQAQLLNNANPKNRVWIYKNIVIAYPWFPSVREKMLDPQYSGWFLRFDNKPPYHVPQCDDNYNPPLCSEFWHSQDQTPGYPHGDGNCPGPCDCGGVPCGFYLFDHRNSSLRAWLIDEYVMGPTGVGARNARGELYISGVYLDDHWSNFSDPVDAPDCASSPIGGPTEVNSGCVADMGLTQRDTTALADGWRATMLQLQQRLLAANAFSWAYFTEFGSGAPFSSPAQCTSFFKHNATALYGRALVLALGKNTTGSLMRDLATFLLVRGPYAWFGHGWQGCSDTGTTQLPPEAIRDAGVPLDNVTETSSGLFQRRWSHATVTMDCSTLLGNVIWQ